MSKKPTVLMILDGFGLNDKHEANAVYEANTPNIDGLMKDYPFVRGNASGLAVGLPDGQMGNSEVGHLNMGAGRIVYQELTRITKEIEDGSFFKNEALLAGMKNAKDNHSSLHLYGLLSDGGVHSHITHLYGLLEMAKREGLEKVYVHCFLDGRDTSPTSGKGFMEALEAKMKEIGVGEIATVSGRYYAMDRDNRWDRVEKAYQAIALGDGNRVNNAVEAVAASYAEDVTDEFVVPTVVEKDGKPLATINDNDTIIFFNFRPDRAREISRTFCMTNDQLTAGSNRGYYGVTKSSDKQIFGDFLVSFNKNFGDDWSVQANFGGSISDMRYDALAINGPIADGVSDKFLGVPAGLPNFFAVQNLSKPHLTQMQTGWHEQTQSLYASADVGFKNTYYLTLTGRNDWPSQLAGPNSHNSSFFYPSVGLSVLMNNLLPQIPQHIMQLWKIRASYASVGSAFSRYIANPRYTWDEDTNSWSVLTQYPMYDLKPERTNSFEVGMNFRFINDITFDATFYHADTKNQTFNPELPVNQYSKIFIQTDRKSVV